MGETLKLLNLESPDYYQVLSNGLWSLFLENYYTDVELVVCGGERVSAHRLLLAVFCPHLKHLVPQGSLLHLNHLQHEDLKLILEFIYSGKVIVDEKRVNVLREAAVSVGLQLLVDVIDHFQMQNYSSDQLSSVDDETPAKVEVDEVVVVEPADVLVKVEEEEKKTGRCKQTLQCPNCDYTTNRKDSFRNHLDTHDPNDCKKYVCEVCSKPFRSRGRYRRHVRCHQFPELLLKCCHCDYQSIERATLHQHMAAKHQVDPEGNPLKRNVQCPDCDYVCVAQYQLKNHALRKHGKKPFKCEECGYASVRRSDVDKHIRMKHRNERPYMCDTCGRCSKTKSAFTNHLLIHNGEKTFKCGMCNLAFHHSYQLRAHSKLHVSDWRPFLCHLCSYACRRNYHLQTHIRKVHKEGVNDVSIQANTPGEQQLNPTQLVYTPPSGLNT